MIIKSNFKDYYDCIQAYGQDKDVVYIRNKKEIRKGYKTKTFNILGEEHWSLPGYGGITGSYRTIKGIYFHNYSVGFCGKMYNYALIGSPTEQPKNCKIFYQKDDIKHLDELMEKALSKREFELGYNYDSNLHDKRERNKVDYPLLHSRANLLNSLERNAPITLDFYKERAREFWDKIFKEAPIFISDYWADTFTFNGNLHNIQFAAIVEPYTAFQTLRMWFSNQASPEKPIPQPDDETLAEIKGFDKWSFRKPPTKKKK